MPTWKIAAVQMDCRLGAVEDNLAAVRARLAGAADGGARLVVFPECVLTGYGFASRAETERAAQPIPGPATDAVAADCAKRNVWAAFGLLERAGDRLYNACALVGPTGQLITYRKVHLPCLGADRFTDPGDRPFTVHDLGGLRVGVGICFDSSFPETARILALHGADLVVLPTNWATQAIKQATLVTRVRALENHIYYAAVNRVGDETGFHFVGHSSVSDVNGDFLAIAEHDREAVLYAEIDPDVARVKKVVHCAGEYEIDRLNWRRPEMYAPLVAPQVEPFTGHNR
ncbi:MAG TPA: carbon-nitrogen hydrolase family protein [Fimbriiglobus sp.]|jgi:predicted amidohydrolase|nr:carbon-nitrogen hydrolase family protein [Fimbriiglobus sp.]